MASMKIEDDRETAIATVQNALLFKGHSLCDDCGGTIPQGRIKAMPSATRCVDCQSNYEGLF